MTLTEICEYARQLATEHGWNQADPTARMLHLTSEIGEVADALIALQTAMPGQVSEAKAGLGDEIFDAIWNLCALANITGIDLDRAARDKVILNADRSWPASAK